MEKAILTAAQQSCQYYRMTCGLPAAAPVTKINETFTYASKQWPTCEEVRNSPYIDGIESGARIPVSIA